MNQCWWSCYHLKNPNCFSLSAIFILDVFLGNFQVQECIFTVVDVKLGGQKCIFICKQNLYYAMLCVTFFLVVLFLFHYHLFCFFIGFSPFSVWSSKSQRSSLLSLCFFWSAWFWLCWVPQYQSVQSRSVIKTPYIYIYNDLKRNRHLNQIIWIVLQIFWTPYFIIFSRFLILSALQESTLSRRCGNVCLSSPFLNICLRNTDDPDVFYRFDVFLHRFMSLCNGVGMCQFKLDLYRQNPDDDGGEER